MSGFHVGRGSRLHASRGMRLLLAALLGALAALTTGARALAQEAGAEAPAVGGSVAGYDTGDWMNLVLRLALVLVVIWVAIVGMRWWVRRMNGASGGGSGRMLQVLESRSLGPNRSLQLVKLGNRAVLLGVTSERINAVLEVTDPVEVERLATPVATSEPTSFRDAISRLGALTRGASAPASGVARERSDATPAPVAAAAQATMPAAASAPQRTGNRWLTLARWVVGLEDGPREPGSPAANRSTGMTAPGTAARGAAAPGMTGRAPVARGAVARSRGVPAAARAGLSPAVRATMAAELPASRAARARSGYGQNEITGAQRAISPARERRAS